MGFEKYQHVERFGTEEVKGINDGEVYIFPKIDGTNGSVWFDDGAIHCASRNRELSLDNDNQGFMKWVVENSDKFIILFNEYPHWRLYGEWLVPHSLKTYRKDAWRKFYVFDVMDGEKYIPYSAYDVELDTSQIDFIPALATGENLSEESFLKACEHNTFLIEENSGVGEGVVIKNYDYKNRHGRVAWAKVVRNEFKDKHKSAMGPTVLMEKDHVEQKIVNEFVTEHFVEKVFEKIKNENNGEWHTKFIPKLLAITFYDLVREESWNFVKKYKNPFIDFKQLQRFTVLKVKQYKSEIF